MNWGDAPAWAAFVVAALALYVGWKARHDGQRSADASARSAAAAEATLEEQRREARERRTLEATPNLEVTLHESGGDRAILNVHLSGPDHLGQLDYVAVTVVDDDMQHTMLHPSRGVSQEDVDAYVWGPFRFTYGSDGADQHGRSAAPFPLVVGKGRPLGMKRTRPGRWMEGRTQEQWQGQYLDHPVRLKITCRRGDEEWSLTRQVTNPAPSPNVW